MLLTCLLRRNLLTLNTDLGKLAGEMRGAAPDYFLNVPALLERMRKAVDEQLWKTGGLALAIYRRAKAAWMRKRDGHPRFADAAWLALANAAIFPTIRKKMIGDNLKALICGSAPLSLDTQLYFNMLGIPVLQVYGLTETTGICTLDDPRHVEPGRVGPAISGIEMKLGENDEIIVRGPNIFPGLLEPSSGNRQGAARWLVSYRRPGRSRWSRELANYRAHQEPDHSGFRPQHRPGADRRRAVEEFARRSAGSAGGQRPRISFGDRDREALRANRCRQRWTR